MDIEIDYNPHIPRTLLKINGVASDNMYSALFPVRHYPLQTWLCRNGAWKGLGKILNDIARGRHFRLAFIGRPCDFEDISAEIRGLDAEIYNDPRYDNASEKEYVDKTILDLHVLQSYPAQEYALQASEILGGICEQVPVRFTGEEGADSLRETLRTSHRLVLLEEEAYLQHREMIHKCLFGSFARPWDSVAVLVPDQAAMERLAPARDMGLHILLEGDGKIDLLHEKYTVPEQVGAGYEKLRRLAVLAEELYMRRDVLRARNDEIRDDDSAAAEEEYSRNADEIRWMQINEAGLRELGGSITAKLGGE